MPTETTMPHLTLEHPADLPGFDPAAALRQLNQAAFASGLFAERDIKSRALPLQTYAVGTGAAGGAFLHLCVALLPGRSQAVKAELSAALLRALGEALPPHAPELQLSVEMRELDAPSYAKEHRRGC